MPKWELSPLQPDWFHVEIDGFVHSGRTPKNIHSSFMARKVEAGERIEPGDEDRVWEAMKAAYPRAIIKQKEKRRSGLSIIAAWSFIRFIERRMKNKSLVSTEEAQRRANICLSCPMRSHVSGCSICKNALSLFVTPPDTLKPEPPESCYACGCYLPLKVWVPREVLGPAEEWPFAEPSESFVGCWMLE